MNTSNFRKASKNLKKANIKYTPGQQRSWSECMTSMVGSRTISPQPLQKTKSKLISSILTSPASRKIWSPISLWRINQWGVALQMEIRINRERSQLLLLSLFRRKKVLDRKRDCKSAVTLNLLRQGSKIRKFLPTKEFPSGTQILGEMLWTRKMLILLPRPE